MQNGTEEMKITKQTAGADERTPSKSQYFSWINSTNEGSTEEQTIANLDYFRYLRDKFGMQLDIYAWDAGNLDGAGGTYESLDSPKLKKQFPRGYAPVGEVAKELGIKLGVWCGPDGFGNTPEEEAARYELMVSLCRDHNFGLFKMDAVCGGLREDKQDVFIEMMKECRKYSPELILLNHRLKLGKALPYATTFLLGGEETYMDVHMSNVKTAPHHRERMFHRAPPEGLTRLTEDHGVCISSCIDYFEDELIYQAFNRCLILAPEIYGNPWLMRDEEHARLARIYNLHRTYRDILVDGMLLPAKYGCDYPIARGNGEIRFIATGNPNWEAKEITVELGDEIGFEKTERDIVVSFHHPYEKYVGTFKWGDSVKVTLPSFRAALIEIAVAEKAYPMLTGCSYEVLHETDSVPDKVKIYESAGNVQWLHGGVLSPAPKALECIEAFDNREGDPIRLDAYWEKEEIPENVEQYYETAQFAMDNDSFEARELRRSGETSIPEVKAARDAFFAQDTYRLRGCESRFAFDGKDDTFFGSLISPYGDSNYFMDGGLRVDFGDVYDADEVLIEFFSVESDGVQEIARQVITPTAHISEDLADWKTVHVGELRRVKDETIPVVVRRIHNIKSVDGERKQITYKTGGQIRYFRLASPLSRIYKIALIKDGKEISLDFPKAINLLPSFRDRTVHGYRKTSVAVPEKLRYSDSFLAVGINGEHGVEGVYVVAELDGKLYGCPDRACSYLVNSWECGTDAADECYTYYLPISEEMRGRELTLHLIEMTEKCADLDVSVHLCESHSEREGIVAEL